MPHFSETLFEQICTDIATTDSGLIDICKRNGLNSRTFYKWIANDEALRHRYTHAREEQAELLADQIIKIADDSSNDSKTIVKGKDIVRVENTEWTNRSKLRVEARKWVAAKLKPKKYGDKVETETKITYSNAPDWLTGELV